MATTNPIDQFLASLDEPKRATLTSLRDAIMAIVPEAEQCISYGMPAFKLRGKTIAGFATFDEPPFPPATQPVGNPPASRSDGGVCLDQGITAAAG